MKQFPQDAQLAHVLAENNLTTNYMNLLAEKIVDFHRKIDVADLASGFDDLDHVLN